MDAMRHYIADVLRATASLIDPPRFRTIIVRLDERQISNAVLRHTLRRAARGPGSL